MTAHRHSSNAAPRAVVVGSGPNGLTAAALLARQGWEVDVYEGGEHPGGAAASAPLLGEGTIVDLGAAGHPFGVASPVFRDLRLEQHGLQWVRSAYPMAHPAEGAPAALLHQDLASTAEGLGRDARAWRALHAPVVEGLDAHLENILGPMLRWPKHPLAMARFGLRSAPPAAAMARALFRDDAARTLFLGSAAHAITPLGQPLTGAFGTLFGALGMTRGWPVARGGTGSIVAALLSVLESHGGRVHTGHWITDLRELPQSDAVLLNLTPSQVLRLSGPGAEEIPPRVRNQLGRWRYGAAAYKVDFLLDGPVPWSDPRVAEATTVHVAGTAQELVRAESEVFREQLPERPFVLVCQQQAADPSRAHGPAEGRVVLWAYAHVPAGYVERRPGEVAERIASQIERFAPGFRDRILERRSTHPAALERWNPNLIGGDVAGGAMTGLQSVLRPRPSLDPYRLAPRGLYLASSSAPPGAGVHGMPGAWAARAAMADLAL